MSDPLDYDIGESIIKDGAILQRMKEDTNYWPVLKDLIESEIRACFRAFLSKTDMKMSSTGEMVEAPLSDDDLKQYRARAMGAKEILEMIDGKIADMEIWVKQQQEESENDVKKTGEIFAHHRERMESELTL